MNGNKFEQCISATPESPPTIRTTLPNWRRSRPLAASVYTRRKTSGGRWDRPERHRLLDQLRNGDMLVVWKLDRLSTSLGDVLTIMERPEEAGAGFRSLIEAIGTTTPAGRMMMQMVGALPNSKGQCSRSEPRPGWTQLGRNAGSVDLVRSSLLSSRLKMRGWFKRATTQPLMAHGCSRFIRRLSVDSLPGRCRHRGRPTMPNNVDGSAPLDSESDTRCRARTHGWPAEATGTLRPYLPNRAPRDLHGRVQSLKHHS